MSRNVIALLDNQDSQNMIKEVCKNEGILFAELQELVEVSVEPNRAKIWDSFDDILDRIQEED